MYQHIFQKRYLLLKKIIRKNSSLLSKKSKNFVMYWTIIDVHYLSSINLYSRIFRDSIFTCTTSLFILPSFSLCMDFNVKINTNRISLSSVLYARNTVFRFITQKQNFWHKDKLVVYDHKACNLYGTTNARLWSNEILGTW